jgi:NADH-quinone oxidoreductase subunit J
MTAAILVFLVLAMIAVGAAVAMLFSRNTVYSALFLILNFLAIAMIYLTLGAPFVALAQITVYAAPSWCSSSS